MKNHRSYINTVCKVSALLAVLMAAALFAQTNKADELTAKPSPSVQLEQETDGSNEPADPKTDNTPQAGKSVMMGEALDGVNFLIAVNSLTSSFNPIDVSPELRKWLAQYFEDGNKVEYELDIKGCREPFLSNGAKTTIPAGAQFGGTLKGALNVDILITEGEVGIIDGEIFIGEGTHAAVNGEKYIFSQGSWVVTNTVSPIE